MPDEIKRFGAHERPTVKKFELETFCDDGTTRVHAFQLVPIVPAGHVTALMDALEDESEKAFGLMAKLIARLLDNTDGVPARWTAARIETPPEGKRRTGTVTDRFIGPDNEEHPWGGDAHATFEHVDNGSSRRRWLWLMDPDNEDEAVHLGDLADIAKWVVSEAVDRPTPARTSSTRGSRKTKR